MSIKKVAVLGAGVMGSGIAAHVTNAGIPVLLLDIVPEGANDRNTVAAGAVARMLKTEPAAFMHRKNASLVTVGNLEDDLDKLADADWIIEAVIERLDVKRDLYKKVDAVRKPGAVVSSNTSTIPMARLTEDMPEAFRRDFLITHFFNPPRYMRLLELVTAPETNSETAQTVREFCDRMLGKGVVECKDTPGFIGNRIGIYWLQVAVAEAMALGVSVEEADAVVGRPMGIPRTGVFGLLDLVGIDLMPHILKSLDETLSEKDAFREYAGTPPLIEKMIADGYTGRKGKGGFYRLKRDGGKRVKEALDLTSGEYREAQKVTPASVEASKSGGLRALVTHDDNTGRYAWRVLAKTLHYAASLVPEIADDIVAVDEAMKLGYNWKQGPFELIDQLGAAWFADRLKADGMGVPALVERAGDGSFYRVADGRLEFLGVDGKHQALKRAPGVLLLSDIKLAGEPVAKNASASLWDIGDGVLCLEFRSKMNALEPDTMAMIKNAVEIIPGGYKALVIYNEGSNFSVGANIGLALYAANIAAWNDIENMVRLGQEAYRALKHAPFPVVGAPSGMALGGGCEVLLHCDAVEAHAETYMGLVEVGVGLVPGWGGCKELLVRASADPKRPGGPMPPVIKAFETISMATVAKSAVEAKDHLYLRPDDGVVMNRDRVLAAAKDRALKLAENYTPPESVELSLPGPTANAAMKMAVDGFRKLGKATPHDEVVAGALAGVLS
ncbi:MAG: 3-hydroxyacyl-CoA dehydrogenase/enoyl-CoA hydratase family protein, partial [Gammaproteobacteria bacterium]|nr:3-hydroxyacyl-CoA dehydrogenase/enoyl-CoA hydratase family protein [Gammaproteobacteria bacterium]